MKILFIISLFLVTSLSLNASVYVSENLKNRFTEEVKKDIKAKVLKRNIVLWHWTEHSLLLGATHEERRKKNNFI